MAASSVIYTGNGSLSTFTFPFPYISTADVFVFVNGVSVPFTFNNASAVTCSTPPASGTTVTIKRLTNKDAAPVNFTDGSVLLEADLDLFVLWSLYVAQESSDAAASIPAAAAGSVLGWNPTGTGLINLPAATGTSLVSLMAPAGASLIGNVPASGIAATNVQAALSELDAKKAALSGATFTGPIFGDTSAKLWLGNNSLPSNLGIGNETLSSTTTGTNNTAVGNKALSAVTTGLRNYAAGVNSLGGLTTGSNNTAIGDSSGTGLTTGSGNTIIGSGIASLSPSLTNNIVLASGNGVVKAQHDGTNWALTGNVSVTGTVTLNGGSSSLAPNARQTVQSGAITNAGYANMLSSGTGSGLALNLAATVIPMSTAFAQGITDSISTLSADTTGVVTIAANNLSFITQDYVSPTAVTWGTKLAPRQEGPTYNQAAQSCLSLNNINTDDFGNTWTSTAVTYSNTSPIIAGTYMGVFNGTSSYIRSTAITSLGSSSWTVRCKIKPTIVTGTYNIFWLSNTGNYGVLLRIVGNKLVCWISSNGGAWDILNSVTGNTTLSAGTSYDIEVTFDAVSGKYIVYLNGVAEPLLTITSALKVCSFSSISLGTEFNSVGNLYSGTMQGFEILPYCVHPNAVAFTPSTALANISSSGYASDWYLTSSTTTYQVSGASINFGVNPTFTAVKRVYVGEAVGGATTVTSVVNYALRGTYYIRVAGIQSANKRTLYSHNIGSARVKGTANLINKTSEYGFVPGQSLPFLTELYNGTWSFSFPAISNLDRNTTSIVSANGPIIFNSATAPGGWAGAGVANWDTEIKVERDLV